MAWKNAEDLMLKVSYKTVHIVLYVLIIKVFA